MKHFVQWNINQNQMVSNYSLYVDVPRNNSVKIFKLNKLHLIISICDTIIIETNNKTIVNKANLKNKFKFKFNIKLKRNWTNTTAKYLSRTFIICIKKNEKKKIAERVQHNGSTSNAVG